MKKGLLFLLLITFFFGQAVPAFAQSYDPALLIENAEKWIGVKYKYGGTTPKSGFDCSGYTSYVFAQLGITLPHSSKSQYKLGNAVEKQDWKVGDLLFFNTSGKGISHVGIYIGEHKMIHASSNGIVITDLSTSDYYQKRYVGARRVATFEVPAASEQTPKVSATQ